ncbi:MAG: beta-ketoacyl synthase chain length factor [Bacteroidota bacterium]|nr:beta-ketoacyl synthase chain length factor [Bacteroidota bacterium]
MRAYIRGTGLISPQSTFSITGFPDDIRESDNNLLRCIEPSYLDFLNPVMARRMGRVIKMGITSAIICMKNARLDMPDAIITGTALGCLGDTENFLKAIIADDEQFLTPTSFIQSIQNSVSAQIALHLNCTGHNFTFAHKGFSFESALLNALMLLEEGDAQNVLTGGIDEMTDHNYFFYDKLGLWKKEKIHSSELLQSNTPGTIGGEGSAFFVLSKKASGDDYAILTAVKTIYNPESTQIMQEIISSFLNENHLGQEDIDLVLYGFNGDNRSDHWYASVKENFLTTSAAGYFKHLCGEYQTSGSFALWLAACCIKNRKIPDAILLEKQKSERLNHVLIYNMYGNNHSLLLLKKI